MSSVRAVIAKAFPFSRIAVLRTEDGRWLGLTRYAQGFEAIELRVGVWLACDLPEKGACVVAVRS